MNWKTRIILILIPVLLFLAIPALADNEAWTIVEPLASGVELYTTYFSDGDRQTEHYLTLQPGGSVKPMVWYGSRLVDKESFEDAAALVEAQGKRVIAGTNGDYYVLASGQPVGLVISEGRIITSDGGNPALGFLPDGSAFFGMPALHMSMTLNNEEYRLAGINKSMHSGDFFLFTEEYGDRTPSRGKTYNLILVPESDASLCVNSTISVYVESVVISDGPVSIPQGRWLICLTQDSDDWRVNAVNTLSAGDCFPIRVSADDPRWSECVYASGSLYKLISDGVLNEDLDTIDDSRSPRTAVGIREDGSILFYTIDGRQKSYSAGLTLTQTAQRLLALGCVEAGALDGGGSTILHAQASGEEECPSRSIPSDGRERDVSTYLFLVTEGPGSGTGQTMSVRSSAEAVLCGASLQLSAGICDEKGAPVSNARFSWYAAAGVISADGLFIAPAESGVVEVTAEAQGLQGLTKLLIIDTPDSLRILYQDSNREVTRLELEPGESVDLTASSSWGVLQLTATDEDYLWECTGNAGTIDQTGRFTASAFGGDGSITVHAGAMSMTIGVSVPTPFVCVDAFEEVLGGHSESLIWSLDQNADHVQYGFGSLRLDYDLSTGNAELPISWGQENQAHYLYFWVFGDGSGNGLYAGIDRNEELITKLDYSGWKLIAFELNGRLPDCLTIKGTGRGVIWLDQALLSNDPDPDTDPPQIRISFKNGLVTAFIHDVKEGYPEKKHITLTVDGKETAFLYDRSTGKLQAEINNSLLGRATVQAWDCSGNFFSASVSLQTEFDQPFCDMQGHWGEPYAAYLYHLGVITGTYEGEELSFDPEAPVTRAEFALYLYRWLGLSAAEGIAPEFSDAEDIPSWAEEAVNAVASLGLIKGEQNGDRLDFNPYGLLTRAQAATILGRMMPGGSPYADLAFPDTDTIPFWAVSYVSRMTFLGIFNGFEDGTFRPFNTLTRAQTAKLLTEMR